MKTVCSYVSTNSADATLVACTSAGLFCGAAIGGGVGTLTVYDGTVLVLTLVSTANNSAVNVTPTLPVSFRTSINATCSGTSACTVFFALAN